MVICKKYNFVFLRVPKNASTSLATWFVKNCCGDDDIHTKIGDSFISHKNINDEIIRKYSNQHHYIHLTLQELVDENLISFNTATKFETIGVIRNPLHRQLSLFFFLNKNNDTSIDKFRKDFRNGCHSGDMNNQILQSDYFKLNGKFTDSKNIWLYENINDELNRFINNKNIREIYKLESYKSNRRPKTDIDQLVNMYYDDKTKDAVEDYYKEDFLLIEDLKNVY